MDRSADLGCPRERECATVDTKRAVGLTRASNEATATGIRDRLVALLLSAATANAQGKYLLWSHFIPPDGEYWQVNYAFESKKECKSVAAAVLREAARRRITVAIEFRRALALRGEIRRAGWFN